jgi:hypothetical protein
MPTIQVTARFELRFDKQLTDNQFANLENGMALDNIVDETEIYERLRTDGECEMDWDFTAPKKPSKKKVKPTTARKQRVTK